MIEKLGDGFRVTGTMLVADATALLEAGRSLLQGAGAGSVMVVDLLRLKKPILQHWVLFLACYARRANWTLRCVLRTRLPA